MSKSVFFCPAHVVVRSLNALFVGVILKVYIWVLVELVLDEQMSAFYTVTASLYFDCGLGKTCYGELQW
jgi:hypothetical protein